MAIQGVVSLCVRVLKNIRTCLKSAASSENSTEETENNGDRKEFWTSEELERLLQFVAKIFMLQFPLYAGPKSAGLRNEEVSAAEATQMAVYCDVHDSTGRNISNFIVFLINLTRFFFNFSFNRMGVVILSCRTQSAAAQGAAFGKKKICLPVSPFVPKYLFCRLVSLFPLIS